MTINLRLIILLLAAAAIVAPAAPGEVVPSWSLPTKERPALDVPYVPTPPEVVAKMLSLADVSSKDVLYDLGCGDGRIVVTAAKERKVRKAVGFDLDPQRIRESNENARQAGVTEQVSFQQKNLFDVDLSEATVLSLYLLPSVNLQLRPKLFRELKPGTRIVSHDFDMAEWQPDQTAVVGSHTVYYWVLPANASGSWEWSVADGQRSHRYELKVKQRFQSVETSKLLVDGERQPVTGISINGARLEFITKGLMDGRRQSLRFRGSLQGDSLRGTVATADAPENGKRWTAERDPSTAVPLEPPGEKQIQVKRAVVPAVNSL